MITIFPLFYKSKTNTYANYKLVLIRVGLLVMAAFLSGPLFLELPKSSYFWREFAPLFSTFVVLFFIWELNLAYISRFIFGISAYLKGWKKILRYIPAIILSILSFYWLGHFEQKISEPVFFIVVALLGIRAIAQGCFMSELERPMLLLVFVFITGVSNLSAYLLTGSWYWQFIVPVFSVLCGLFSQSILSIISCNQKYLLNTFLLRLNVLLLFLAPVSILLYVNFAYLDSGFLTVLFSLAPVIQTAEKSRVLEKLSLQDRLAKISEVEKFSCYSSILFIVTLIASRFITF